MIDQNTRSGNFNGLAANYGRYRVGYSRELFDVLEKFGLRKGVSVLDVGCGTGISTESLLARGMKATGIDPSSEMLETAIRELPAASFVSGRAEELPFADGSFDAVVSAQAFHWFEADRAFAELIRVVKPGGPVAVWWKILCNDEPMRSLRAAACAQADLEFPADPLQGGFGAFYRAPFASRALRVLPFTARFTIEDWIGYERSRASARNAFGAQTETYIAALERVLVAKYGPPTTRIGVRYTQFLYVGHTAASVADTAS
jgi:ubiquinone/menaquinone biosynthesis C-methylase UbiE